MPDNPTIRGPGCPDRGFNPTVLVTTAPAPSRQARIMPPAATPNTPEAKIVGFRKSTDPIETFKRLFSFALVGGGTTIDPPFHLFLYR